LSASDLSRRPSCKPVRVHTTLLRIIFRPLFERSYFTYFKWLHLLINLLFLIVIQQIQSTLFGSLSLSLTSLGHFVKILFHRPFEN
jgi:hypothetical protein